jgi:hypothetical protein
MERIPIIVPAASAIAATLAQIISTSSTPICLTKWNLVKILNAMLNIVIQRKPKVTAMSSEDLLSVDIVFGST